MTRYKVLEPVSHDQKEYAPGAMVELPEAQATALLACNAVAPVEVEKPAAEKPVTAKASKETE